MNLKLLVCILLPIWVNAQKTVYTLSFPEPHSHYAHVEINAQIPAQAYFDLMIPNWTPGSYMIREFGKNVEELKARSSGKDLKIEKITKSAWRIYSQNFKNIEISYKVYAFELTVRTSFVDATQALINGASVFMYAQSWMDQPIELIIKPDANWKNIALALPGQTYHRKAPNYDGLVDSPIQLGNFDVVSFTAAGLQHHIALVGKSNLDTSTLAKNLTPIIESCVKIFGSQPCKEPYWFIVQMNERGGGGLEHLNSTVLVCDRNSFATQSGIQGFLGLAAHEYFHLWNVKRLRPKGLGPFDYQNEVYSPMLWIAEGFTSYYDQKLLRLSSVIDADSYLNMLIKDIHNAENSFGRDKQAMSEASHDAWVKYYKKNENSVNTTVSYYTFGSVAASLIDLEIIAATEGQKSLDDVMRAMFEEFCIQKDASYTEADWLRVLKKVSGKDFSAFFAQHINSTQVFDYDKILSQAGLKLVREPHKNPHWGMKTKTENGKLIITEIWRNGSAFHGGLSVNDEILAIENQRASENLLGFFTQNYKIGQSLSVWYARDGLVYQTLVELKQSPYTNYKVEPQTQGANQKKVLYKWLNIN
jgi:predicted metalloprotease with PDZ domain